MSKLNRKLALLAAVALLGLSGCASKGGGNTYFGDAMVTARVKNAIRAEPGLKVSSISVSTDDSVVSLKGSVKTRTERVKAAEVTRRVDGVKRVKNELTVAQ